MKKNVLRILLAFVMASLVFALVACDGGGEEKKPADKHTTHVDSDGDGKCDVCKKDMPKEDGGSASLADELDKILNTLSPYIDTFKGAKATDAIGIDIGIGGYFNTNGDDPSKNDFKLRLAANAKATDPELDIGVSVNSKDYLKIGYKEAALYLLEGLNMINTNADSSNKIKMDVTYLKDGINNAANVGMQYLAWLAENKLAGLDLNELRKGLTQPDESGKEPLVAIADGLLTATSTADGATITVSEENMQSIVGLLKSMVLSAQWPKVEEIVNQVIGYAAKLFKDNEKVSSILNTLTLDKIINEYMPRLEVKAKYENDAIKNIAIAIVLEELKVDLGLSIDLTTLSLENKADISFSSREYYARDLAGQVKVNLDNKGLSGVLDLVVNTGSAFAAESNPVASAVLKINNEAKAVEAAFDGKTVYLDMTNAFTALNAAAPEASKFSYVSTNNFKTIILDSLKGLKYEAPGADSNDDAKQDGTAAPEGESLGIWGTLYKWLGGANPTKDKKMDDVIVQLDAKIGKYLKFKLVDESGKAKAIGAIGEGIADIYNENKALLTGAVNASGTVAGAQLFDAEGANLLGFVSKFIQIPAIKVGADNKKEIDFENEAQINDAATLKEYIEFVFGLYPADGQYADYVNAEIVRKITGKGYGEIIDGGMYVYAGYNAGKGLDGYVGVKANKKDDAERYVEIGGFIGFVVARNFATLPEEIEGTTDFTAIVDGRLETDKGYYQIFDTTWKLLDEFLAYGIA